MPLWGCLLWLRVIEHRVERRRTKLRVVLEVDLMGAMAYLDGHEPELNRLLTEYGVRVTRDILEVAHIIRAEDRELGSVHWFDKSKGYGFIRDYNSKDVFVHFTNIVSDDAIKSLEKGARVRFKRRQGRESIEAIDVELVDE